jgi:hypothetical protein
VELIAGAQSTTARQRRWAMLAMALMAGVACLGFGGQLLGSAAESRRDVELAVAVSVTPAGPAAVAGTTAQRPHEDAVRPTRPAASHAPANAARLPLGLGVAAVPIKGSRLGGILVVGFVPTQQSITLRVVDSNGSSLASSIVVSRPPATAAGLRAFPAWSFETVLKASATDREGGPDGLALAVRWIAAGGAVIDCVIPLARASGSTEGSAALEPISVYASCS